MYCFKCGQKVNNDAIYCQNCGANLNNSVAINNSNSMSQNEIDREALKIYLGDVLAMECIKNKLRNKISELNRSMSVLQNRNYYKSYPIKYRPRLNKSNQVSVAYSAHFFYDGNEYFIAVSSSGDILTWREPLVDFSGEGIYWQDLKNGESLIKSSQVWRFNLDSFGGFFQKQAERSQAQNACLRAYEEFKSTAPTAYQENKLQIDKQIKMRNEISIELEEAEKLSQKIYELNIIPDSFRNNLYAIYYLHNFVTTSSESFTTALLHYDLNEIKSKLDTIIAQQQQIIINQALLAAQNQNLIAQNKMQLEKLSRIESNTARAAQYNEIASYNTEACAWIGLANYLK